MTNSALTPHEDALKRLAEGTLTLRSCLRLEAVQRLSVAHVLAYASSPSLSSLLVDGVERAELACRRCRVDPWVEVRSLSDAERERLLDVWRR